MNENRKINPKSPTFLIAEAGVNHGGDMNVAKQLIDIASLHLLEKRLEQVDIDPKILWDSPQDWSSICDL